jgi:hypothetical protein
LSSWPFSSITVSALWAKEGFVASSSSMSEAFLLLDGNGVPAFEVVQVFLHDHVAAAGERGVLLADDGGVDRILVDGVLRAVDEAQKVAVIEVLEAVHLVGCRDGAAQPRHDLRRKLEAHVHALGADVEEEIARRRRGVMLALDLTKGMQLPGPRRAEQPVPGVGAEAHDAGQPAVGIAEADRAQQARQVGGKALHGLLMVRSVVHRHDEEHGGARQRRGDRLGIRERHALLHTDLFGGLPFCVGRTRRAIAGTLHRNHAKSCAWRNHLRESGLPSRTLLLPM